MEGGEKKRKSLHWFERVDILLQPEKNSVKEEGEMVRERHRVPGTRIVVDWFRPPRPPWVSAFFLTHYHADHYGGLTAKWREGRIYASPTTARLLLEYHGLEMKHLVQQIPLGTKYAIEEERESGLSVTLLDANHCPGSVLMLFELPCGKRYLHTGDMRYDPRMKLFKEIKDIPRVDILFQDTTYCNPKYKFPLQKEAVEMVSRTAREEVAREGKVLILVATYLIGKERVLQGLSNTLGCRVCLSPTKDRVIRLLELPYRSEVFTTDPLETNVHVTQWEAFVESVPWGFKPHYEKLEGILQIENVRLQGAGRETEFYSRVVGFVPTGWTYDVKGVMSKHQKGACTIYGVPYSEHSSYSELLEWVSFLRPTKIVPTVGGETASKEASILSNFKGLLDDRAAKSAFFGKLGAKRKSPDDANTGRDSSFPQELQLPPSVDASKAPGSCGEKEGGSMATDPGTSVEKRPFRATETSAGFLTRSKAIQEAMAAWPLNIEGEDTPPTVCTEEIEDEVGSDEKPEPSPDLFPEQDDGRENLRRNDVHGEGLSGQEAVPTEPVNRREERAVSTEKLVVQAAPLPEEAERNDGSETERTLHKENEHKSVRIQTSEKEEQPRSKGRVKAAFQQRTIVSFFQSSGSRSNKS